MKFFLIFVTCGVLNEVESLSRNNNPLQKAFMNISASLENWNYLVSIVAEKDSNDEINLDSFHQYFNFPHGVMTFKNESEKLRLNSSAIVFLESVASLKNFNNRVILHKTFSNKQ